MKLKKIKTTKNMTLISEDKVKKLLVTNPKKITKLNIKCYCFKKM